MEIACSVRRGSSAWWSFLVAQSVLVLTVAWFLFASIDPDYRFAFADDNLMRLRSLFFIVVCGYLGWVFARLRRFA